MNHALIQSLQADLRGEGGFHKWLMDMLPQPVFVRSATGKLLYANRATHEAVGVPTHERIAEWQLTPRAVPRPAGASHYRSGEMITTEEGEADLPRIPIQGQPAPRPLPAPTERHAVMLQDQTGTQRCVADMHRIPFWMLDSSHTQHAVVMYMSP